LLAREPDRAQHGVQKLPSAPDERLADPILVCARRLSDDEERRVAIADTEHGLPPRRMQRTARTVSHCIAERIPIERRNIGSRCAWLCSRAGYCRRITRYDVVVPGCRVRARLVRSSDAPRRNAYLAQVRGT
jgi:hypothetical protein